MTDLQHLQKVILDIAKYIDSLCLENGIEYYLLGGSAIGAVRHKGFIPWDDDLDIVMDSKNYDKFIKVCREQLDTKKYYFQEGLVDWPMPFSKVKIKGTVLEEPSGFVNETGERGIYVDVFKVENAPASSIGQKWQYLCAKYYLCYCLLVRGWDNTSFKNRLMMVCASPLKIGALRRFVRHQIEKYNETDAPCRMFYAGRYRLHNSFYDKSIFSNPLRVPFEDTELPVPAKYDEWLTQIFGDYMTPPPAKEQVGLHLQGVDFGKY